MFEDSTWSMPTSKGTIRLSVTQAGQESEKSLFQRMDESDKNSIKDAILRKFQGLYQNCSRMNVDEVEMRLTIKLMIHSFKHEGNAF